MRTLVDIPEADLAAITRIAKSQSISRAELIRRAVNAYIGPNKAGMDHSAFGAWKGRGIDGVEFQRKIRAEWER